MTNQHLNKEKIIGQVQGIAHLTYGTFRDFQPVKDNEKGLGFQCFIIIMTGIHEKNFAVKFDDI